MLTAAEKLEVYSKLYNLKFGEDPVPENLKDKFLLVVAAGVFMPSHF